LKLVGCSALLVLKVDYESDCQLEPAG
jgi:hypothetical protein